MSKKRVLADYYCPTVDYVKDGKSITKKIELSSLINSWIGCKEGSCATFSDAVVDVDIGRLQVFYHNQGEELFEVQILRLREQILPVIAKGDGSLQALEELLGRDDHCAESCTCLYDPKYNLFVAQRNTFGAHIAFVERYLSALLEDHIGAGYITMMPITEGAPVGRILGKNIKEIECQVLTNRFLADGEEAENPEIAMRPQYLHMRISAGRRKEPLKFSAAHEYIKNAIENPNVTRLKARYIDGDGVIKPVDLLSTKMTDFLLIEPRAGEKKIFHSDIFPVMKGQYIKREKEGVVFE